MGQIDSSVKQTRWPKAKTKVAKRSPSMELLGLIVFFLRCSFVFSKLFFFSFFICFSSCQFVFFSSGPDHHLLMLRVEFVTFRRYRLRPRHHQHRHRPNPRRLPHDTEIVSFLIYFFAISFSVFNSFHVISSCLHAIFFQSLIWPFKWRESRCIWFHTWSQRGLSPGIGVESGTDEQQVTETSTQIRQRGNSSGFQCVFFHVLSICLHYMIFLKFHWSIFYTVCSLFPLFIFFCDINI